MKEMVGGCCVCSDERGWPDNPLVYCDGNGCTVAVHQACYGIVTVPTGPWYCRKCESPETKGKVRCELCPSKSGALKRTDTNGWAHVVCALYIPEVRFGNVTSMEPIVLRLIPAERYNKTCYICQESNKSHRSTAGACMQCNKSGCKQQFHVTCAQSLGLLCEEAGNYLDNVKYCGYCQHHYSKLKKGGNVKTIPPYKPVLHHSPSSESSEKEGGASPMAGGSGTPTHAAKAKGPGRKSSHTSSSTSGKNTPNSKTPTNSSQPADMQEPTEPPPSGKRQKTSDKNKKKPSPMRRGSGADVSSGSKNNTPAPSPQHSHDSAPPKGGSTPNNTAKATPPSTSPGRKTEPIGVISSAVTNTAATSTVTSASVAVTTSVVQMSTPKTTYQESVITNTEAIDTKQTKKRKAVAQAQAANAPVDYAIPPPPPELTHNLNATQGWDHSHDGLMESQHDKAVKKAKTEVGDIPLPPPHFSNIPPPPPAHSPAALPSPRHLPSPMPGPSGMNQGSNITRSPSLPLITPSDMSLSSPHIFHQPQKAAMDPGMSGHPSHGMPGRSSWGGLNVSYEMQQDPNKPGVSGVAGPSKEPPMPPLPPAPIRNKKRAAMAASMINMATQPPPSAMHTVTSQTMTNVRRPPLPTPPLIYQEIKDSPPSSPSSDNRPLKPKMDSQIITAPHMLGNELNPESMAAARLQEQLTAELAAHAAGQVGAETLIPPPLINKASGQSGSMSRGSSAQSLDQLLERQWEQGSQFLMEQAQHFDIASLLSCLHQLRTENVRLEEHVGSLLQRRDHLLAVNARLAIPLTAAIPGPSEPSRCPRENGSQVRPPPPPRPADVVAERSHQQVMMREPQPKPS